MRRTVRIEGLAGRGSGVARPDGEVWLVAGALPGETVEAAAVRRRAGIVEAEAVRLLDGAHPARDPEPCPHASECGGCDWPHVQPRAGAALKAQVAAGAARGRPELAARLAAAPVSASPGAYRLRARLHWDPRHRRLGFYRRRSWSVTPVGGCRILSPRLVAALPALEEALAGRVPEPVDLEWLERMDGAAAVAALRPARCGPDRIPVEWLPAPAEVSPPLVGMHTLSRSGRVVAGWGEGSVTMPLATPLAVPVGAFFQVNRHLVPLLFRRVGELAGHGREPAWDLHAGVGFLAAAVGADRALTLVEPFRPAAEAARINLPRARVHAGRTAEAYLRRHARLPREALVLLDPPRAGLSPELRRRLAGWHPRRVVALACDPATWARDTAALLATGLELRHVELHDLFPCTHHVEVVAVLEAV